MIRSTMQSTSIRRAENSSRPQQQHIGKLLLAEKPHDYHQHDQHRWYEDESITLPSSGVKHISDHSTTSSTTIMCHHRRRKIRSYDIKTMRKQAVSLSGSFHRSQRRSRSLTTVSYEACSETQEFFNIQSKNILDEKSDMEKLTTDQPPEGAPEQVISLPDLAGILSTDLSSAIDRGLFSSFNARCSSIGAEYRHESGELRNFRGLKRKGSKRSTRSIG
jgi:hypothetical protein